MYDNPYFAAIDLGSNSFHMLIGRLNNEQIEVVDREKEMVQIARGLTESGDLDEESRRRALDCLHRFSERLRDIPSSQVRAVGTKTLRAARKSAQFLKSAEEALGHPIQIISGYEEARLVYCGLSHTVTNDHSQRLVIDIGGGSTEFIIGRDYDPTLLESLGLGCVSFTNQFFKGERAFSDAMNKAYLAACDELESIRRTYTQRGWELAYGTSGTMKAIAELVNTNGASIIDYAGLTSLMQQVMEQGAIKADLPKLRRDVLPAGIAILKAIFDQLKITELHVADATLKEGLIFDTIGRFGNADAREITVDKLMQRYECDQEQATRVRDTALSLWAQIKDSQPGLRGVSRTKVLKWAASLHETGLSISHASYHQHSHYLLRYSDLAGFGRFEQYILATLVRCHRKKVRSEFLSDLDDTSKQGFLPLLICLRLAFHFNRRREGADFPLSLSFHDGQYRLQIDRQWLQLNPLTRAGLLKEIAQLANVGIVLALENKSDAG